MADAALILSGVLMGIAGAPHCMAMCGAASSVAMGRCNASPQRTRVAFQLGRVVGYAAGGAAAASSVVVLQWLGQSVPVLRPLWTLLHLAAFALGMWLLVTGRQPAWMPAQARMLPAYAGRDGWQRIQGPTRAAAMGGVWIAMPCGLLQSALIVAALASTPWAGAMVMGGFGLASSPGLWAASLLLTRGLGGRKLGLFASAWAVRFSGAGLALASGWALGHGLWQRVSALCL